MIQAGRAHGDYLARTYEYTHPSIARIWEVGQSLLRHRCWAQNHLLGQVVRLDHLVTIFELFYDGSATTGLVKGFRELKLEINRDSVDLIEAMIRACEELQGEARERRLSELARHEEATRAGFQRRLCAINEALHERALDLVGLPRLDGRPPSIRRTRSNLPRHAAAALLAAGMLACGGESPGDDQGGPEGAGSSNLGGDTGFGTGGATTGGASMGGSGIGGAATGGSGIGGAAMGGYLNTGGMFEAPPPPMGGYLNTGGMFEAPPPPMGGSGGVVVAPGGSGNAGDAGSAGDDASAGDDGGASGDAGA